MGSRRVEHNLTNRRQQTEWTIPKHLYKIIYCLSWSVLAYSVNSSFHFLLNFIYLFFWLHWVFGATGALPLVRAGGVYPLVVVHGLLTTVASLVAEHRLWGQRASVVVMHGLSCPEACGILPNQGLNPCINRWILNHCTPDHQGSNFFFIFWSLLGHATRHTEFPWTGIKPMAPTS